MDLTPAGEAVLAHVRIAANSSSLNGFATASIGRFLDVVDGIGCVAALPA